MYAAIYCRLSREDQEKQDSEKDSGSIKNQKDLLIQFAACQDWSVYDIYVDEDYSGADRTRPAFNRLIRDAQAGRFQILLCKTQSRFIRDAELAEQYIHRLFPQWGIQFVCPADQTDTRNPGNKKARQLNALVNEWFLEELSGSVRSALTCRRQQGFHIGSSAPYGYRKDPAQRGHLLIDPDAAKTVKTIFSLYTSGLGQEAIARRLNQEGIPNPTQYKQQRGLIRNQNRKNSGLWHGFTIRQMLSSPVYKGDLVQGKTGSASYKSRQRVSYPQDRWIRAAGTHVPIIEPAEWDRVQSLMSQRSRPAMDTAPGSFAGKVRCLHCLSRMRSVKNGVKRGFSCSRHSLDPNSCPGSFISLMKLERIVSAQLQLLSEGFLDQDRLYRGIDPRRELLEAQSHTASALENCRQRIDRCTARLGVLYLNQTRAGLPAADQIHDLRQEKKALDEEAASCQARLTDITEKLQAQSDPEALAQEYLTRRPLGREMVQQLLDSILVGRDPVTGVSAVEIQWRF